MALPTPRKKPFTERERDVLLSLLKKYADIIENKRTDSVTVLKKKRTWAKITEEYNSCPYVTQESTMKQLEKAWKNLKAKERSFRLAEYLPKTYVGDPLPLESSIDGLGPHFLLSMTNPYSVPIRDSMSMWSYEKEHIGHIKDNGEVEDLSDEESMNEIHDADPTHHLPKHERHNDEQHLDEQEQLEQPQHQLEQQQERQQLEHHHQQQQPQQQQQQQYAQISRHAPTRIGDIEITAMQPVPGLPSQNVHQPSPDHDEHDAESNTPQSFGQPESTDIREVEMHLSRDEELHELKMQLASAQLAKVKAETELQTQLLREQLRKAKAEADLAELLLQRNRSVIVTQ